MTARTSPFIATLDDLAPGATAVVHRALYSEFRDFCPMLALRPGERVRCIGYDGSTLRLRTESGLELRVERPLARLIEASGYEDTPAS